MAYAKLTVGEFEYLKENIQDHPVIIRRLIADYERVCNDQTAAFDVLTRRGLFTEFVKNRKRK